MDHDRLRIWVTLYVSLAALAVVLLVVWITIPTADKGDIAHVATGAFTVIGTVVGLFTGHAVGASGKEKAEANAHVAETRAREAETTLAHLAAMHPNIDIDDVKMKVKNLLGNK